MYPHAARYDMPIRTTAFLIDPSWSMSSNRRARPSPSFVPPPKTTHTLMRGCTGRRPAREDFAVRLARRTGPLGPPHRRAPEVVVARARHDRVTARAQSAGKPAVVEADHRVVAGRQLRGGPRVLGAGAPVLARLGGVEDDQVAPVAVRELERAVAEDPRMAG